MLWQIYLILQKAVFSCWWRASEEEMQKIANSYNYQVQIRPPSFFGRHPILKNKRLIGECRRKERLLLISSEEIRVFWHELGHGLDPLSRRTWRFPWWFPKKLAEIIVWAICEVSATSIGYFLVLKWCFRGGDLL